MKLYLFPAGRAVSVPSLTSYLGIDREIEGLNYKQGDQLKPENVKLNPNKKQAALSMNRTLSNPSYCAPILGRE